MRFVASIIKESQFVLRRYKHEESVGITSAADDGTGIHASLKKMILRVRLPLGRLNKYASVVQLVARHIANVQVRGSSPLRCSNIPRRGGMGRRARFRFSYYAI